MGTIGRYSGGGLYERSIYLTLFSAAEYIDRDIKCERSKIERPRFHMVLLGHPFFFINMLKTERFSYDDGLFKRFLTNSPKPPTVTAAEMRAITKSQLALHCIFYFLHVIHYEKKINYTFSEEALTVIDYEFDLSRQRVAIVNEFDSYIG